jgi:hypothetical protein
MNKFNDSNFTGDWRTDPMGTFRAAGLRGARGGKLPHRLAVGRRVETHAFGGINPEDGLISYGPDICLDAKGQVWDQDYGLVGNLRLSR